MANSIDTPERMVSRKNDHIRICSSENVESAGAPFDSVSLWPEALPECNFESLDTTQTFLGRSFALPLLITGMTGGVQRGQEINETLAQAAQSFDIPMGLGSQKMMITQPEFRNLFDVRKVAPRVFLIGNIGLVSLNYGITLDSIARVIDDLQLNAFAFHVNALQECVQPEGERDFSNLLRTLEQAVKRLPVPVVVKEVGSGMSPSTFQRIAQTGVRAVDVGGRGGTSWSAIEGMRGDAQAARVGELFRNWGLPTDLSLRLCLEQARKSGLNKVELVATGGIRDGLQIAKAVALGATMCGVGLPLFRMVVNPPEGQKPLEAVGHEIEFLSRSLRVAMFCSGARTLNELPSKVVLPTEKGSQT